MPVFLLHLDRFEIACEEHERRRRTIAQDERVGAGLDDAGDEREAARDAAAHPHLHTRVERDVLRVEDAGQEQQDGAGYDGEEDIEQASHGSRGAGVTGSSGARGGGARSARAGSRDASHARATTCADSCTGGVTAG